MEIKETLAELVRLDNNRRVLEAELDETMKRIAEEKEKVASFFEKSGIGNISTEDRTIYLDRQIWAGVGTESKELFSKTLINIGMGNYLTANHQSLSGWVRDFAREHGLADKNGKITASIEEILAALPEQVREVVKVTEKIDVRIRKK